ncbi:hypothetical protein C2G38_2231728 [Gigaspora rosea]|uniref:Uncharacterized protein n=1 Tax=Gigaspora rosea TaxID=44941 RepID=A0A397TWP1_9GLOM|nr:hypothetical protein C2G38_2231728 [Gigaspora rosea]
MCPFDSLVKIESAKIMFGDFPPNSRDTCFKLLSLAAFNSDLPVAFDPLGYAAILRAPNGVNSEGLEL